MASIAELLLARGAQQADARRRQGELSMAKWQGLAQSIANAGNAIQEERVNAPIRAQQAQIRDLQTQQLRGEVEDRNRAIAADRAFKDAIAGGAKDEDLIKIDPERADKIIKARDALTTNQRKNYADTQSLLRDVTLGINALPADMQAEAYVAKRQELIHHKIINPEDAPEQFDKGWFASQLHYAQQLPKAEPFTLHEGDIRYDESGNTIAYGADKSKPEPKKYPVTVAGPRGEPIQRLVTEEELAKGIPAWKEAKSESTDVVQIMGLNGVPVWTLKKDAVGKPAAQAPRAVTGQERQTLAFYNRAKDSVDTITAPKEGGKSLEQQIADAGLLAQGQLQYAPNVLQSAANQSYRQAQRAFTEARLRKESGAAIPTSEYENDAKTYFAQPGDGPEIIEQKRAARQTVLEGLKFSAGKAYEEYYGEPNISPARGGAKLSADELLKKYGGPR